ncbi:MAG: hypothetical protein JWM20_898 [Patescibacteria group bacterium]|nr:hypothetical protein [Patescibacteria group bacterium]
MKGPVFKIEQQDAGDKNAKQEGKAARVFETHKDFFANYTKHGNLEIKPATDAGLETSAIDLSDPKRPKIFLHDDFLEEKSGGSDIAGLWAASHECEHLVELLGLLNEKDGPGIWRDRQAAIDADPSLHILDNCLDDVKMNRSVVAKAPVTRGSFHEIYDKKLFADTDFTKIPKHLQFAYALLNEDPINGGRACTVSPDVRQEITRLRAVQNGQKQNLFNFMTNPDVGMKDRLKLQEMFFEPVYKKFKRDDDKNWEPPKDGDKKEGEGSPDQNQGQQGEGQDQEGGQPPKSQDQKPSGDGKGKPEKKEGPSENGDPKDSESEPGDGKKTDEKYKELYDKFNEAMKQAVPKDLEEKAVEEFIDNKSDRKSYEEQSLEAYALAEGVTVEDLKGYRRYIDRVEELRNPETDELLIEEIRNIFRRIIAERTAKLPQSKMPQSEGVTIRFPAQAVVQTKAGNPEPEVWQTIEEKEAVKELIGKFDVTLVCDRSRSMGSGGKLEAQRTTSALVLEALREFGTDLEDAAADLESNLEIRTEVWSFGDDAQCELLKALSPTLSEKERVLVYQKLSQVPGNSTKDYQTLEKLLKSLDPKDLDAIAEKKLRKIVFVVSDGESSDVAATKRILAKLREKGILVYGIGVTNEARSIETTYAPSGRVCPDQNQLPVVMGELLKEQLETV